MPDKWPLANGNWSNAANWNGGTKPQPGDDVFADGRTLTIDENVNVLTLRITQRTGGTNGGTFILSSGVTVNVNSFIHNGTSTTFLTYSGAGTSSIAINTVVGHTGGNSILINANGTGTLNVVANVSMTTPNTGTVFIQKSNTGALNFTGDITITGTVNNSVAGISVTAGTVNIIGTLQGAGNTGQPQPLQIAGGATISITGNVVNTGVFPVINAAANCSLTVTGNITASAGAPAIQSTNISATIIANGNIINTSGVMAVYSNRLFLGNSGAQFWDFTTSNLLVNRRLYTADTLPGVPAIGHVRSGTVYGASNELTGTLVVPLPANVLRGVATDNTIGTADLTAADFWNHLLSAINTDGSIGKLIKDFLDAAISTRLATSGYTAPDNTGIAAIKAKTDQITFTAGNVNAIAQVVSDKTGYSLTNAERTAIAVAVEAALLNDGDGQALLNAIVAAIGNQNIDQIALIAAIRADIERAGGMLDNLPTAAEVWSYATRALTVSPDVPTAAEISTQVWADEPERLKNVATVESTGDQLAALTIN